MLISSTKRSHALLVIARVTLFYSHQAKHQISVKKSVKNNFMTI